MIRSFRHKGIDRFFRAGDRGGIQARHAKRLRLQLARLDHAGGPHDMAVPNFCTRSRSVSPIIGRSGLIVTGAWPSPSKMATLCLWTIGNII